MGLKAQVGHWLFPRVAPSRHVLEHLRLEYNAFLVRSRRCWNLSYRSQLRQLAKRDDILANIGCGPFGLPGWVNLDLHQHRGVTLPYDCRRHLPFRNGSCRGIHVEHFFEHLEHAHERLPFLRECLRCLAPDGVIRIIVPDAGLYVRAYAEPGWDALNRLSPGGKLPSDQFEHKMEALNTVFLQGWEHYGGYDFDSLASVLTQSGFTRIAQRPWREGTFPGGCIDRENHRAYSLYIEAQR